MVEALIWLFSQVFRLLQACHRPVFDRLGRRQRAQEIAEIVGQCMKLGPDRVSGEGPARQPGRLDRALTFLDPLFACAAFVVEGNDPLRGARIGW
jgi:hypothetical protein